MERFLPCKLAEVTDVASAEFDSVVIVTDDFKRVHGNPVLDKLQHLIKDAAHVDPSLNDKSVFLLPVPKETLHHGRLIVSHTGAVNRDFDDVRRFKEAAIAGTERALKTGAKAPLLVTFAHPHYPHAQLSAVLGALHALYVPLEIREEVPDRRFKAKILGVFSPKKGDGDHLVRSAGAVEAGRTVARDIGAGGPERMPPPKAAEYIHDAFKDSQAVKVTIIEDYEVIKKEYPMTGAVGRAANTVPRHRARIVKLLYEGEGEPDETLMMVGKGITFDSGGIDVKTNGAMVGMSRDKGGAAAIAGFFKVLDVLRPKHLKVIGTLSFVRNSIGEESYTCDEVITARSGRRIRIVNTDAEGRLAMVDPLCEMKEVAAKEKNVHIMTLATLTGHAVLTVGDGYCICMDNGPALAESNGEKLRKVSEEIGDVVEVSRLRREDYLFHHGESEYEDLKQSNTEPSSRTPRGHMTPAAFLIMGSGLDKHGIDSDKPLKYSHLDVAGGWDFPHPPTGSPVAALAARYIFPRL